MKKPKFPACLSRATRFQFFNNLNAAKALEIPPILLATADEAI